MKSSSDYETITHADGTFKKRRRVLAPGSKRHQWQYYCVHGRQKRTCIHGCNKSRELSSGKRASSATEQPSRLEGDTSVGSSCKSNRSQGMGKKQPSSRSQENAPTFPVTNQYHPAGRKQEYSKKGRIIASSGGKGKDLATRLKPQPTGIGTGQRMTKADMKRAAKFEIVPRHVPVIGEGQQAWQKTLRDPEIVSLRVPKDETGLVPQRTPVNSLHVAYVSETKGFCDFAFHLEQYKRSNFTPEYRDALLQYIITKDAYDYDFYSFGKYSMLHCTRTLESYWEIDEILVEGRWYYMSECVGDVCHILSEEGIHSPYEFRTALSVLLPSSSFKLRSQFDSQLLFCQISSNIDYFRDVDLDRISSMNFEEIYVAQGVDLQNVYMEPKVMFKAYRKSSSLPKYTSRRQKNTLIEIIATLIRCNFFPKFKLQNAGDVRSFKAAATILEEKKYRGMSLMKLLIVTHQLWCPSRMKAFATSVRPCEKKPRPKKKQPRKKDKSKSQRGN